jgi:hypothetical protein
MVLKIFGARQVVSRDPLWSSPTVKKKQARKRKALFNAAEGLRAGSCAESPARPLCQDSVITINT